MEGDFIGVLSDAGMAGAFIIFLVVNNKQQSKRVDDLVDRLMQDITVKLDHIAVKLDHLIEKVDK